MIEPYKEAQSIIQLYNAAPYGIIPHSSENYIRHTIAAISVDDLNNKCPQCHKHFVHASINGIKLCHECYDEEISRWYKYNWFITLQHYLCCCGATSITHKQQNIKCTLGDIKVEIDTGIIQRKSNSDYYINYNDIRWAEKFEELVRTIKSKS